MWFPALLQWLNWWDRLSQVQQGKPEDNPQAASMSGSSTSLLVVISPAGRWMLLFQKDLLNQKGLWWAPCCGRGVIISNNCLSKLLGDFQRKTPPCSKKIFNAYLGECARSSFELIPYVRSQCKKIQSVNSLFDKAERNITNFRCMLRICFRGTNPYLK